MTNRLIKWSRHSSRMVCLLAACSLMYACSDDYALDDEMPKSLGTNLYDELKKRGDFQTYLDLLGDEQLLIGRTSYKDVLGRTGSKTLFVANDSAWKKFFERNASLPKGNPWHTATCYDSLTLAQKRLLVNSSMLNNAIVMENLASSEGKGDEPPTRGEFMRRNTDYEPTDTIGYLAPEDVPFTYSPIDEDYWARFREPGKGIWLSTDNTENMMITFTNEHMKKNGITDDDFLKIMGVPRATRDVFIYDARIVDDGQDNVCQNGYINIMEKPLTPMANMAEIIRTSGRTSIFSHMLDRFSAPIYDAKLTEDYASVLRAQGITNIPDSIFVKRYFSDNSVGVKAWSQEPGDYGQLKDEYTPYREDVSEAELKKLGITVGSAPSLKFDPGWNTYVSKDYRDNTTLGMHKDMAAMFIPNDNAMKEYFKSGGGKEFIEEFGNPAVYNPDTIDNLLRNIDMIPLDRVQRMINVIMMQSFTGSVPSKMTKLRDDANEQLFFAEDIEQIDTCIVGCNGAVYIMNKVYGPADFTSVTAPAVISTKNNIMNWAIYNGSKDTKIEKDFMSLNYYAYLKAMQSKFTFFLPSDSALLYYYDAMSFKSNKPRMFEFRWNYKNGQSLPIDVTINNYGQKSASQRGGYNVFVNNGIIGSKLPSGSSDFDKDNEIPDRLKDILESHTIVHDGTNDIWGEDEYFLSKNGNAIRVIRDPVNDSTLLAVQGGLQIEDEAQVNETSIDLEDHPGIMNCKVTKNFTKLYNGQTFVLNAPLLPTYRSVWSIFTNDGEISASTNDVEANEISPYGAFYRLTVCADDEAREAATGCGLIDGSLSDTKQKTLMKKYMTFQGGKSVTGLDENITFFNNYHYTAFIPNAEAIKTARDNGLPTWQDIIDDYMAHRVIKKETDPNTGLDTLVINEITETGDTIWEYEKNRVATAADSARISAKITYLTNFIRYHFADNTIFVDRSEIAEESTGEMVTSCYDKESGLFVKLHVRRKKNGENTEMFVRDHTNYLANRGNTNGSIQIKTTPFTTAVGQERNTKNVLARDITCTTKPQNSMRGIKLTSSSTAVIHLIGGVLNHVNLVNGRHDSVWETPSSARKYVKRYAIPDNIEK